ncbi:M20 family metallopeptidase [Georgenia sp. AZ-5]|uniref:M20 family metallopeptidase n=1 Tax=Georgenia sp. AZ-5 TaxID=3367526 RepID=UPI003754EF43
MDVLELTRQLVAIDSQNPGPQEREIAGFVTAWARERGFDTAVLEPVAGRPNVVVTADRGGGRRLGLSGHLDTKPVGDALGQWRTPPLELTVDGDDAYGLGATDMKGGVAAMMLALERFAVSAGRGSLSLVLTADEEQGSDAGAKALVASGDLPRLDALVIGEPSGIAEPWEAVHVVSRGICCFEIEIRTTQGHSGLSPGLGRNATLVAADLLRAFERFRPTVARPGTVPCSPTVNPGIFISGGVSYGTWPGRCTVGMEVRLVPGMDQEQLHAEVAALTDATLRGSAEFEIRYLTTAQGWMPAVELDPTHPLAQAARAASSAVLGRDVPFAAFPGGTDATYFMGQGGIPTITSLGPGWISVAHGANERVGVLQLAEAADVYTAVVEDYLGREVPA